ncbi:MAG TPA: hypothetical protein P5107_02605 [Thermotogota bacterium]|nr:hypothetical protein [Thermotogota bacterium]HRW33929.1 hypothetical protein [Thermotogota bacterium]
MLEVLTGTDDFSKYDYCKKWAKKEGKQFKVFKTKDWQEFEAFLSVLCNKTLFSVDYCCYGDFPEGLSKKKLSILMAFSDTIEQSESNALFIGSEKSIKGLKKGKAFELPKPWKDDEWKVLVKALALELGLSLSQEQINRLVFDTGPDMWRIHNELSKFAQLSDRKTIEEKTFTDLFYSYMREDLQAFVLAFINRNSTSAMEKLNDILLEYNPIQIIYRLGAIFQLMLKIKLISSKRYFTFNDVRELASKTQTNIPLISQMVGFSFKKNEFKENLSEQYSRLEIEDLIDHILFLEINYKSGEKDFRSEIIGFYNQTRR